MGELFGVCKEGIEITLKKTRSVKKNNGDFILLEPSVGV